MRAALAAVLLAAAAFSLLHVHWYTKGQIVDYGVYQTYGDKVANEHAVPYRDFQLEYPPGALPVFVVPSLAERWDYRKVFQLEMALCLAVAAVAAAAAAGPLAGMLTAVLPLALGSVVLSRFDLWPSALSVLAVALALRRRPIPSAIVLGTAFAAKLWPAVLVPVLAIWLARRDGARAAWRWLAAAAATAAVWFVPFVALAPGGVWHAFHVQTARPIQIESLGGAILMSLYNVAGTTLHMWSSYGSQNLTGPGAHAAAVATTVVELAALAALYAVFARSDATSDDLVRYCAAAVAVTIAFGKVFSPQFLIWLVPLVPLVRGRRLALALPLFVSSLVLTQLWFPRHYWTLVNSFSGHIVLEVLLRDLAVVALAAVLVLGRLENEVLGEHRTRIEALERVRAQVE